MGVLKRGGKGRYYANVFNSTFKTEKNNVITCYKTL